MCSGGDWLINCDENHFRITPDKNLWQSLMIQHVKTEHDDTVGNSIPILG